MEHLRILYILLVISVLGLSCKHNVTEPVPDKPIADFPNTVGNFWVYSVLYGSSVQPETVTVRIVGDTTILGNMSVKIWQTTNGLYIDTTFVRGSSDTIDFIPKYFVDLNEGWTRYVFPLEVGKTWRGNYAFDDTSTVVEIDTVSGNAGTFPNAFLVKESAWSYNFRLWVSTWMVPKVGIVRQNIVVYNFGPLTKTSWELLRYDVSP